MKSLYESILDNTSNKIKKIANMKSFGDLYELKKIIGVDDVPFYGFQRTFGKDMTIVEPINDIESVLDEFNRYGSMDILGDARTTIIKALLTYIDNYETDKTLDLDKKPNKDKFLKEMFDDLQSKGYISKLELDNNNTLNREKDPKGWLYIYLHYKFQTFVIMYKKR